MGNGFELEGMMQNAKSTTGVFTLPCGYLDESEVLHTEVALKEISGKEESILASKNMTGAQKMTALIVNCMERIGTITDKSQFQKIAQSLPQGDRDFLFIAIRRTSLGDRYSYLHPCPNTDCVEHKKPEQQTVDLSTLTIQYYPYPTKRVFTITLPSGKVAKYRVMTGIDQEMLNASKLKGQELSLVIAARLISLNDVQATMPAVESLGLADRNALREAFEEAEGGVDLAVEMTCPSCGLDYEEDIEIGQPGFFFPYQVQKKSKRIGSG